LFIGWPPSCCPELARVLRSASSIQKFPEGTAPPAFDPLGVPTADLRRSRDPADHLGFLRLVIAGWRRRGHFLDFEVDELLSIAFIETADLLAKKYDPTRATVTSFLSSYLFGRVQYAALRGRGMRRQHNVWRKPADLDEPPRRHSPSPSEASELAELVANLEAAGYPTSLRFHEDVSGERGEPRA
jgi:hypothetical protein